MRDSNLGVDLHWVGCIKMLGHATFVTINMANTIDPLAGVTSAKEHPLAFMDNQLTCPHSQGHFP